MSGQKVDVEDSRARGQAEEMQLREDLGCFLGSTEYQVKK